MADQLARFQPNPWTGLDRITFEPGKMGGRACVRGLRITVGLILALLAEGADAQEILTEYPELEAEDIKQALAYGAWLARERNRDGVGERGLLKAAHGACGQTACSDVCR